MIEVINQGYQKSKSDMESKTIKKADKLTRQSFALLDRIKSAKQKKGIEQVQKQENILQILHMKLFNKCPEGLQQKQIGEQIAVQFISLTMKIEELQCENKNLRDKSQQLMDKMNKQDDSKVGMQRIQALNQQIEKLEEKCRQANNEAKCFRLQNERLAASILKLQQNSANFGKQKIELEQIIQKLTGQLEDSLKSGSYKQDRNSMDKFHEIQKLKQTNQELQQRIKEYDSNVLISTEERNRLLNEKKSKQQLLENVQEEYAQTIHELTAKIVTIGKQLSSTNQERVRLSAAITGLNQRIFQIQTVNSLLKEDLSLTVTKLQDKSRQSINKEKQFANLSLSLQQISDRMVMCQQQNENLRIQLSTAKLTSEELTKQLNIQDQQFCSLKSEFAMQRQKWLEKNGQLQLKMNETKQRLIFFKSTNEDLSNEKIDLINNINLLSDTCLSLERSLQRQKETNILQRQKRENYWENMMREKQIQQYLLVEKKALQFQSILRERVKHNQGLINQLTCKLQQKQQAQRRNEERYDHQVVKLQIRVEGLEKDNVQLVDTNKQVQIQLLNSNNQLNNIRDRYEKDMSKRIADLQEMKARLILNKQQNKSLNQDRAQLRTQNAHLTKQKSNLKGQIQELNQQLSNTRKQCHENLIKYQSIQNELQSKVDSLQALLQTHSNATYQQCLAKDTKIEQTAIRQESRVIDSNKKHMETIKQLTEELTEAYSRINIVSSELKQIKSHQLQQKDYQQKRGVKEQKERGKSLKKIVGIFGF